MKSLTDHTKKITAIGEQIKQYGQVKSDKKLRFYHGGSNSTRENNKDAYCWIDISNLNEVIEVNTQEQYVLVEPNVPMDALASTTLRYGLIPPVVMEFPGITVGGGINGAALESSSFRYGQFNDCCEVYEIILGNGDIIQATPARNQDIFYGISGAYGSLGLLTLIKIRLIKAQPYVQLKRKVTGNYDETLKYISKELENKETDYVEGIVFDPTHSVVITGKLVDKGDLPIKTYSKAKDPWFYEKARDIAYGSISTDELVPLVDYLFRYNRGAFWVGEFVFPFFHLPNNRLARYLLNPVMNTRKLFDGLHAVNASQDWFIQDFYVPLEKVKDLLEYSATSVDIWPIWLCPMKPTQNPQKLSPHYHHNTDTLVDVGIWGQSVKYLQDPIKMNREFETFVTKLKGRKMLYAHQYYTKDEFWDEYDEHWYDHLRATYKASDAFPDVWSKTHVKGKYKARKWHGVLKILWESLRGKHINS